MTVHEQPLPEEIEAEIIGQGWPAFMLEDTIANQYFPRLYEDFPQCQFALYDEAGAVAAIGNSIPFHWDGNDLPDRGWDWVLEKGVLEREQGISPNALSAISITVAPGFKGQGVSRYAVQGMKHIARAQGLTALVAPVRPSLKHRYPLTPIERYIRWQQPDGTPFDPWLRVHWRVGAQIVRACPQSMTIPGTIAQWEAWTEMRFPESGRYIVPGALEPVVVDVEQDQAIYVEPNVWMRHDLTTP
ncbi:MAG: GNAT family N-acetyltransferase [Anaerolineae bacterium]|nr:GNAT family N-acetyltransferase [Anaerolineae bacterium]